MIYKQPQGITIIMVIRPYSTNFNQTVIKPKCNLKNSTPSVSDRRQNCTPLYFFTSITVKQKPRKKSRTTTISAICKKISSIMYGDPRFHAVEDQITQFIDYKGFVKATKKYRWDYQLMSRIKASLSSNDRRQWMKSYSSISIFRLSIEILYSSPLSVASLLNLLWCCIQRKKNDKLLKKMCAENQREKF